MKLTVRQAMLDLMNEFLARIIEKKMWKTEDVEHEFFKAMYELSIRYVASDEELKSKG